jgi:hypothetical protein
MARTRRCYRLHAQRRRTTFGSKAVPVRLQLAQGRRVLPCLWSSQGMASRGRHLFASDDERAPRGSAPGSKGPPI